MLCSTLILVANSVCASPSGTFRQDVSVYDFVRYEYDKHKPYDAHRTNPVIEKYFSRHKRGDFTEYASIARVFNDPEQLADLKATVGRILSDLQNTLPTITEQVKKVAQGNFKSRWIRYPGKSPLCTFLDRNVGSLPWPAQFISRYIEFFLTKYITKEIGEYGDKHSITDVLFERLALLSELDCMLTTCEEHDWKVPVDQILAVINGSILDSYRHLSSMLGTVASRSTRHESRRETWLKRIYAHKYFTSRRSMSMHRIASRIRDIQSGTSREGPRGVIQSDCTYDITSPDNQTEDINLCRLQDVIRKLNDIKFNSGESEKPASVGGVTFLADSGHRRFKNFVYSTGSKEYFLKSLDSTPDHIDYYNSNDILFEDLDSPYIAKIHRVLYNHVALEGKRANENWWTLSEFLPVSVESLDRTDMSIVRRLSSDILNGLAYLQSMRVVHSDLHLENVRGEQVQANGRTEYRFKIIDFGASYYFSLADGEQHEEEDLLRVFSLVKSFACPTKKEMPVFDDFISACMGRSCDVQAKIRRLLLHPFITGGYFDKRRRTVHQPPAGWYG